MIFSSAKSREEIIDSLVAGVTSKKATTFTHEGRDFALCNLEDYEAMEEAQSLVDFQKSTMASRSHLSERLNFAYSVIEDLSKGVPGPHGDVSYTAISYDFKLENLESFESFLKGRALPTPTFLEDFADKFGFSSRWLITGYGDPFLSIKLDTFLANPDDFSHFELIWEQNDYSASGGQIHAVVGIKNTFNYYRIDDFVSYMNRGSLGSGGRRLQYEMFTQMHHLTKSCKKHSFISSKILKSEEDRDLWNSRKCHPGYFELCKRSKLRSDWAADMFSFPYHSIKEYEETYGIEFARTLKAVRDQYKSEKEAKTAETE